MKLNIGCGGRPLSGYINIDQDSIAELQRRYPDRKFDSGVIVEDLDIFDLPYAADSIEEVNADAVLEHLSFKDEPRFLYEVFRILKSGGTFNLTVPDFEATCRAWLEASDDWRASSQTQIKTLKRCTGLVLTHTITKIGGVTLWLPFWTSKWFGSVS